MNKHNKIIFYYFTIMMSLFAVLWIIWVRFLRTRLVKDIPITLTEYGFWFLLYICLIYLIILSMIIFSLVKKTRNDTNKKNIIKELMNQIYIPFIMLDHTIKYNNYMKNNYCNFKIILIKFMKCFKEKHFVSLVLMFQIIPRIILVGFLIMDTFYFHRLEIVYKVVLLGTLPFIFKYFKYNFNDFKEHYIKILESKYKYIFLLDEASAEDADWVLNSHNKFHDQDISVKEYIEFKIQQQIYSIPKVVYNENPVAHDHIYLDYKHANNIPENSDLSQEDLNKVHQDFDVYTKIICDSATIYERISYFQNKKMILYERLFIYTSYFICWFYILTKSYYTYPVDFSMSMIFIENLTMYMQEYDNDPFSMLNQFSRNQNLITLDKICNLIKSIKIL